MGKLSRIQKGGVRQKIALETSVHLVQIRSVLWKSDIEL